MAPQPKKDLPTPDESLQSNGSPETSHPETNGKERRGTSTRGFASMDPERQRAIARKGGEAVSGNRQHMAEIGRKGGEASGAGRNSSR